MKIQDEALLQRLSAAGQMDSDTRCAVLMAYRTARRARHTSYRSRLIAMMVLRARQVDLTDAEANAIVTTIISEGGCSIRSGGGSSVASGSTTAQPRCRDVPSGFGVH
jgi:hypothetical protein